LGYSSLLGAILFYLGMLMLNNPKPNMGGDNGMGYGLGLVFFALGFTLCIILLGISLASKDAFAWIPVATSSRTWIITIGVISAAITFLFSSALKYEAQFGMPEYIHWIVKKAQGEFWITPLVLIPAFVLLNASLRDSLPQWSYQVPITFGFAIQLIFSFGILIGFMRESNERQRAIIEDSKTFQSNQHQRNHEAIDSFKEGDYILNIISYTGRFHQKDIKEKAVAKLKSSPDWENELIIMLGNEYYFSNVYQFIDGNRVDHPELFIEPLKNSIFMLADQIKTRIEDATNLQDWHFEHFGIERLLRAIDEQFAGSKEDFIPAIEALQKAIATTPPERFKDVKFTVQKPVDNWLKKNKSKSSK